MRAGRRRGSSAVTGNGSKELSALSCAGAIPAVVVSGRGEAFGSVGMRRDSTVVYTYRAVSLGNVRVKSGGVASKLVSIG